MIAFDMPNDKAARKVLAEFNTIIKSKYRSKKDWGWVTVKTYSNCREQGFNLRTYFYGRWVTFGERSVSFSENPNSDNIVVYFGKSDEFAYNTNIPDDAVWQNAKYFKYNEQLQAARFIYKYLVLGETS